MFLAIGWREIFEQFDFVSAGCFHNREFDLCPCNARDFTGHLAGLMRSVRKLKTENVLPEIERALEIRNGDARMIRGDDSKFLHGILDRISPISTRPKIQQSC